ncbi:MAG: alkyl hydroperoxide reductase/Thiol specific antioxidant/Mal allergen [Crocinitomicaceae bacterium]|jgi:hypothetical protein|nr:alkyl hydroperoxide reductase/Thiol specific antioxidant/Mal allergen [Crocinitomicaceae bacterium]
MKKLLFSLSLLTGLSVNAQLPDGSIAPDFTLTDINGVSHNLYTYLNQGKTVFIDVSATWCGPCWGFHGTHALDNLWSAHGPMGGAGVSASTTDDVIVIFIEGDGTTNNDDLMGNTAESQGDWVTGVDHPIIDPTASVVNAFNDDYGIGYFPTIYKICPNRIIEEVGQATAAQLYASVSDCPAPASSQVDVSALANKGNTSICGPATYTPKVQIQNYGLDPLTSATITVTMNGTTVSTGTFSGNLSTYDVADVTCTPITDFSGGNLAVTVTANNDANAGNGNLSVSVMGAIETSNTILLSIHTDGYASETSWNIRNANNQVVSGTTDPTLANNTDYNFTYTINTPGCYTFNITDSYGDGIIPTGTINVRDNNNVVIFNDPDYAEGATVPFKVLSQQTTSIAENALEGIKIYPNPSNGAFTVFAENLTQFKTIELVDQSGRTISSWDISSTVMSIETKDVANGNYLLVFSGDNGKINQKIQINK